MTFVQDDQKGGYFPFREHSDTVDPNIKTRHGFETTDQEAHIGEYSGENFGEWSNWLFWDVNPEFSGVIIDGSGNITPTSPRQRSVFIADYQVNQQSNPQQDPPEKREIGAWAQVVPAVTRPSGCHPIFSKEGGFDQRLNPIAVKKTNFTPDNKDEIRPVHGADVPHGFPGTVVQTITQFSHEKLFMPAGNALVADHKSNLGSSSRVFDVKPDGFIDVTDAQAAALDSIFLVNEDENGAKVVTINGKKSGKDVTGFGPITLKTPDGINQNNLCYLSWEKGGPLIAGNTGDRHTIQSKPDNIVQPAHIWTEANFFRRNTKDGPLAFTDQAFPTTSGEDVEILEAKLAFDGNKWRWFVILNVESTARLAKVRWNFNGISDLSEGEIVSAPGNVPTGERIWISYDESKSVQFSTAGTGTIFSVRLLQEDVNRVGGTRDLYKVLSCCSDNGRPITQFIARSTPDLAYAMASNDINPKPWLDLLGAFILTNIDGSNLENIIRIQIPEQWDTTGVEDYFWLDATDLSRGMDFFGGPIAPTPRDNDFFTSFDMVSLERVGGAPIAEYKLLPLATPVDGKINSFVQGLRPIPVNGDPKRSHVFDPINADESKVVRIVSYDETSGRFTAVSIWDEFPTKFIYNCQAFLGGKAGLPTVDQVEIDSFIEIHRTGDFNGAGSDTASGFELRDASSSRTSWVGFFFESSGGVFAPIAAWLVGSGPFDTQLIDPVITNKPAASGIFIDTGLELLVDYSVTDLPGNPFIVRGTDTSRKIIIRQEDVGLLGSFDRKVNIDCDNEDPNKFIFNMELISASINGNPALCVSGNATLNASPECCDAADDPPCTPSRTVSLRCLLGNRLGIGLFETPEDIILLPIDRFFGKQNGQHFWTSGANGYFLFYALVDGNGLPVNRWVLRDGFRQCHSGSRHYLGPPSRVNPNGSYIGINSPGSNAFDITNIIAPAIIAVSDAIECPC